MWLESKQKEISLDSIVATSMTYDVTLFSSWSEFMYDPKMDIARMR